MVGLSFDFVLLNMLGFLSYVVYCLAMYADEGVRREYRDRHHGQSNGVRWAASCHNLTFSVPPLPLYARGLPLEYPCLHSAFSAANPSAASMAPAHHSCKIQQRGVQVLAAQLRHQH